MLTEPLIWAEWVTNQPGSLKSQILIIEVPPAVAGGISFFRVKNAALEILISLLLYHFLGLPH